MDQAAQAVLCHRHAPYPAARSLQSCRLARRADGNMDPMTYLFRQVQDGARPNNCTDRRCDARRRRWPPRAVISTAHAHAVALARAPAGPDFANIVLNNTNVCCFSCCGPKRENLGKNMFGDSIAINPSLPKMPPVLVGKLDEATWKTVLRAMGKTGSGAPDVFLNIFSRLTCTVRLGPALRHGVRYGSPRAESRGVHGRV